MKYVMLLLVTLLLAGCAQTPVVDYDLVETQPQGRLLPPPQVPDRVVNEDTYYRDTESAHVHNLKKYHAYITRQIRVTEPNWGVETEHCGVADLPAFNYPPKPAISEDLEPEEVVVILAKYIRAFKLAHNKYQTELHNAVEAACKR